MRIRSKKILYIIHYGHTLREFYCDPKTGQPQKIIGDGGSNIHIHLIQYFLKKGHQLFFSTYKNNYQYLAFFGNLSTVKFKTFWTPELSIGKYLFWLDNLYKIFFLPWKAFGEDIECDFIFSSTDFLPDALYAFMLKLRNRNKEAKWVASYFLDAPKPWQKDNPYRTGFFRFWTGVLYWLAQRPSYWLIKRQADFVLVTSEPDVKKFITKKRPKKKIVVVQGGVDIEEAKQYLKERRSIPIEKRNYDACFVGRFHYQKGVLELVDIWREVCRIRPQAKLAMIGNGPLESAVKEKVKEYALEKNIDLLGFQTGRPKYQIFKQSKIMVHPATYDSGGMAAAEGMAWGLPGVGFDLEALRTYYPRGMIKTPRGNLKKFAENILKLLDKEDFYQEISQGATDLTQKVWDWEVRADKIYQQLFS